MDKEKNASVLKGKKGIERITHAFSYSIDGIKAAFVHEAAFRQLVWLNSVLIAGAAFSPFSPPVKMLLIAASFLSLIVELFNTAIEAVVDYISTEIHPLAKRAKDTGSAAQMLSLVLLAVLWPVAIFSLF